MSHTIGARQVRFIHHQQVGHFDQAGLLPLHFVARIGSHQQHQRINDRSGRDLILSDADGLDQNDVKTKIDEPIAPALVAAEIPPAAPRVERLRK